MFNYTS